MSAFNLAEIRQSRTIERIADKRARGRVCETLIMVIRTTRARLLCLATATYACASFTCPIVADIPSDGFRGVLRRIIFEYASAWRNQLEVPTCVGRMSI